MIGTLTEIVGFISEREQRTGQAPGMELADPHKQHETLT